MTDAGDRIRNRIAALGSRFLPAIRPLAVPNDFGDELLPVGSAVLIWHRGARYLVSAAHVVEMYPDRTYYIGTQQHWREIDGAWRVNVPPNRNREDDIVDAAFKRVEAPFADDLDGCSFLTADQQSPSERVNFQPPYRSKYVALGYPLNDFKMRRYAKTTVPGSIAYAGGLASPQRHIEAKVPPATHVLIDYEWDSIVGSKGSQRSPKLEGISGGGVFRLPSIEGRGDAAPPTLVAITVEERRQSRLLLGTRVGVFHLLIDQDESVAHPST